MPAKRLAAIAALFFSSVAMGQQPRPIQIRIDLTDAPRRLVHVTELLPVRPGVNDFSYPEWIPSQELPGGPIDNLTGLVFHSGTPAGAIVPWRRDL